MDPQQPCLCVKGKDSVLPRAPVHTFGRRATSGFTSAHGPLLHLRRAP